MQQKKGNFGKLAKKVDQQGKRKCGDTAFIGGRLSWHNLCTIMTDICQTKIVYFIKIYYLYTKLFLEYYGKESKSSQREIH